MIQDSVAYLRSKKLEVIYDAEHFFDGFRANRDYALKTLEAAFDGGASYLTLCDTNGGSIPTQITDAVRGVTVALPRVKLGIHTHNDPAARWPMPWPPSTPAARWCRGW